MHQPKLLRPDWLPAVALSSALALAMLAWNPQVGDLAAQVFRTELFRDGGLGIWNGSWYGGHYTLTYSVLFPPLAALVGPRTVGVLAVIASAYLFDRLVRDRWGDAARPATLWFAAGVVTLLADGQLTFALGVVFGLATLRALQRGRPALGLALAAGCALSSPVAAVFLAGVLVAGSVELAPRRASAGNVHAIQVACVAFGLVLIPNLALPRGGPLPVRLLLLPRDPALVRLGAVPHPRARQGGARAAPGPDRLHAGGHRGLAAPECDGRQRGPARGALRRPGPGGGPARSPTPLSGLVRRPVPRRQPLLAAQRQRHPDRPQRRRPLDPGRLLRTARPLAAGQRRPGGPGRGAADSQPLGVGLPLARRRTRARLAAPDRHHQGRHLLRRRRQPQRPRVPGLAARQRGPLRRRSRCPARLLLGRRAAADPQRPVVPAAALGQLPLARLRGPRPRPPGRSPREARRPASSRSGDRDSPST